MRYLIFPRNAARVRRGEFAQRSLLPVSAACVVANGMREHLVQLCGTSVDLRLWPPAIPESGAWQEILRGAHLHVIRGTLCDAAIVLRPEDARMLAALLFGERSPGEPRDLSPFESEITRRAVVNVAATLAPVCGEGRLDSGGERCDFVTYFELHVLEPLQFCIGIALSREPPAHHTAALRTEHVMRARVTVFAEIALEAMRLSEIAALQPGAVLVAASEAARLRANGRVVGEGTCGVRSQRYAFAMKARA